MALKISVVINTLNEGESIEQAIKSVAWADEIILCDMRSEDKTVEKAKKLGAKVIFHKKEEIVERARNFAISKASGDWIFVLDPDEEVPSSLADRLRDIAQGTKQIDFVRLPRKNLIFGHFMKNSGWWPDYNVRFFKKGSVRWTDEIHRPPQVLGAGLDLPAKEEYAIFHYSYKTVSQFISRMDRYTAVQAEELKRKGYEFRWQDLFEKPLNEFLSRFFALDGYKDGLHGLVLAFLQAFSFLIVYLKVWEMEKFNEEEIDIAQVQNQTDKSGYAIKYWFKKIKGGGFLSNLFRKK